MQIKASHIDDLKIVTCKDFVDDRGAFRKLYNGLFFERFGLNDCLAEVYMSFSQRGAIRGLHYQTEPHAQSKLIYCLSGSVFDVAIDLRVGSPSYGMHHAIVLRSDHPIGVFVPEGFAHGLQALEDNSVIISCCSTGYSPEFEEGVLWSSCGVDWPLENPILSEKDQNLPPLNNVLTSTQ